MFLVVVPIIILIRLLFPELFKPAPTTGVISGALTTATDAPVADATVTLYNADATQEIAVITSGADGKYSLPAEAMGPYHITAVLQNPDGTWLQADKDIELNTLAMSVDLAMERTIVGQAEE
jgi:hypothetical protein